VRICGDDIREMLKARGEGYDATFEIGTGLARKYLALGYSLALDSDCASPKTREFITAVETEYNLSVIWIHINPPEAFILHKLKNFKHTWLFRDADQAIENYEARKPLHEHLDLPFIYRFDTSKENLPEQIEEAALRIQQMVD
jgi:predicted kinase